MTHFCTFTYILHVPLNLKAIDSTNFKYVNALEIGWQATKIQF